MDKRPLKVFLCHASADKPAVRDLYKRLIADSVDVWLDKENLLPGQDWELEIRKAVRESDVVIVCLSKQFAQKGFRQYEVRIALEEANLQPEGEIFIIPARLEECEVPSRLKMYHWVDLFEDTGYKRIMLALNEKAKRIEADFDLQREYEAFTPSDKFFVKEIVEELEKQEEKTSFLERIISTIRKFTWQRNFKRFVGVLVLIGLGIAMIYGLPPLVQFNLLEPTPTVTNTPSLITFTVPSITKTSTITLTPTKSFTNTPTPLPTAITDEKGVLMRLVSTENETFYMDTYEVTNKLYKDCVNLGVCQSPRSSSQYNQDTYSNHPVVSVTHDMAKLYCEWRGGRLPSSQEWDIANQGHPWINEPDCKHANYAYGITGESQWDFSGDYAQHSFITTGYLYCFGETVSVGSIELGKSIFDIYDLIGNVAEWSESSIRILGGSWASYKPTQHQNLVTTPNPIASDTIGFRCVVDVAR